VVDTEKLSLIHGTRPNETGNGSKSLSVIKLSGLYKRFGKLEVLKGLDLNVEEGDIFGLIGENGAGKTTTIKILLCLEHPQKGTAEIFGQNCSSDIDELRKEIGFVSETVFSPDYLTVRESIDFHKQFYPSWDDKYSDKLLDIFDLSPDVKVSTLSRGQYARLKLILAFSSRPRLLIIDEITAGLDALARHDLIIHLKEIISEENSTIFFATNLLYDLEKLATKIAFLEDGKISFVSSVPDIVNKFSKVSFRNFDALDIISEEIIVDKIFDNKGAHIIIESKNDDSLQSDEKIAAFEPLFSGLDLESTFVYLVKSRKGSDKQ